MISPNVVVRPGEESEIDVVLPQGVSMVGKVVDSDGIPVSGAEVFFCRLYRFHDSGVVLATTDLHGGFSVRALSCPGVLGARASGFAPSIMQRIPEQFDGRMEIELILPGHGGALRGQVVSATGQALPFAEILLEPWLGEETSSLEFQERVPPPFRTVGDSEGSFSIEGLPSGEAQLLIRADRHAAHRQSITILEEGSVLIDVTLLAGASVVGSVRDGGGRPLAEIEVVAVCEALANLADGWREGTNENGEFRFSNLPSGRLRLEASSIREGRHFRVG